MLTKIIPSFVEEIVEYTLAFDDGHGNGFNFPCDECGNLVDDGLNDAAANNYRWCLEHPERFWRFNKVVKHRSRYRNPAEGFCECGESFYLQNEYMSACECPGCGKWYNLFGQELLPPEEWEEDW